MYNRKGRKIIADGYELWYPLPECKKAKHGNGGVPGFSDGGLLSPGTNVNLRNTARADFPAYRRRAANLFRRGAVRLPRAPGVRGGRRMEGKDHRLRGAGKKAGGEGVGTEGSAPHDKSCEYKTYGAKKRCRESGDVICFSRKAGGRNRRKSKSGPGLKGVQFYEQGHAVICGLHDPPMCEPMGAVSVKGISDT